MYGLIGKMRAQPGQRDALTEIILAGTRSMPGCYSYIVARDPHDSDSIWITEVWDSLESHNAALQWGPVQAAVERAGPLIAGIGERYETIPVGGHGLLRA